MFDTTIAYDSPTMLAKIISRDCFRYGYRVAPFRKTKDGLRRKLIEEPHWTIDYVCERLKALNRTRKHPVKRVTIPLFDLRCERLKLVLDVYTCYLSDQHNMFRYDKTEIITDLDDLKKCN